MLLKHEHLTLQDSDATVRDCRKRPSLGFSVVWWWKSHGGRGIYLGTFDSELGRLDGVERL
jgi:hypothetical protein